MVLDVRKFKRIKSDVWSNFGDVRLLISEDDVKKFNIDHHVIHVGKEPVLLCKSFVACVKCSAVFSYESHSYGTSTLRSHLKSCGKQKNRDRTKKRRRMTGALCDVGMLDPNYGGEKPVFQEQMLKFRDHSSKLQEQILLFYISKLKPFSLLENVEFKDLLQTFVQIGASAGNVDITQYLCSPNDLIDFLVNEVYVHCEEAFKNEIQFLYGLSFSVSIWLDVNEKISYITLSCHYANSEGMFKSVKYYTTEFQYEQKLADDLSELFQSSLSIMQTDFKRLLVIDYSYNMVNAFNNSEQFIQCICYALNIAVQTVINALSTSDEKELEDEEKSIDFEDPHAFACFVSLISQCRSLVLHFKENKLQSSLPRSLQMCSSTSWKAVLSMLESINSQWEHIVDVLVDRNELELFYFDQELLSLVVDFLEIFRDGYDELSSLNSPTLNLVLPWVQKWKMHCMQNDVESPFLAAVKSFMNSSIDQEVVKRITIHHKIAAMLDPRYKDLDFLSAEDKAETQAHAEFLVRECHETLLMNGIDIHNDNTTSDHFAEVYDNNENEMSQVSPSEEVEEYLTENFAMGKLDLDGENKFNPLQYWMRAKTRYPYLSRVALWVLSCPASAIQEVDDCLVTGNEWMITERDTDLPKREMHKSLFVKSFRNFSSGTV